MIDLFFFFSQFFSGFFSVYRTIYHFVFLVKIDSVRMLDALIDSIAAFAFCITIYFIRV